MNFNFAKFKEKYDESREREIKNYIRYHHFLKVYAKVHKSVYKYSDIQSLGEILITPKNDKDELDLITLNPLYEWYLNKSKYNYKLPVNVMLDIDIKELSVLQQFNKDTGNNFKNGSDAVDWIVDQLRNDEHVFYLDKSFSGKGIKAIFTLVNNEFLRKYQEGYEFFFKGAKDDIEPTFEESKDHIALLDYIHHANFYALNEYLKENYNFKFYNNNKIDYIDRNSKKVNQVNYQSKGKAQYFNPAYDILYYDIPKDYKRETKDSKITKKYKYFNKGVVSDKDINRINRIWFDRFINKYNEEGEDNLEVYNVMRTIENSFAHYGQGKNHAIFFTLKHCDEDIQKWFYNQFRRIQNETTSNFKYKIFDLSSFQAYLSNMVEINGRTRTLQNIFREECKFIDTIEFKEGCDFLGNEYNQEIYYDTYISEKHDQLLDVINENKTTVVKAEAGAGKTTTVLNIFKNDLDYFVQLGLVVFVIPKNMLLEQVENILRTRYPYINIFRNYGDYKELENVEAQQGIILSSTPKLEYLKHKEIDLLVVDEIHDLVKFSNKIASNLPQSKHTLMISATPEPYLLGMKDYYYINLRKTHKLERQLDVYFTNNIYTSLYHQIKRNRKQLVFFNNINKSKDLAEKFKREKGIGFEFLNSKEKTDHSKSVIADERLYHPHYFATSAINDGINFNNESWDDIIIVDTDSVSVFDVYQLSERFRKVDNLNISIIRINKGIYGKTFDPSDMGENIHLKQQEMEELQDKINQYNSSNKYRNLIDLDGLVPSLKKDHYYANEDYTKLFQLENRLNAFYHMFDDFFLDALSYYFQVETHETTYRENDLVEVESNDAVLNIWKTYYKEILNYFNEPLGGEVQPESDNISDLFETDSTTLPIPQSDQESRQLFLANIHFFEHKIEQYRLCKYYEMEIDKTFGTDINFKNNLKKQKKYIIANSDPSHLGGSLELRNKLDRFISNIKANVQCFQEGGFSYYRIKDIHKYLNDNKKVYNVLKGLDGEPLVKLNIDADSNSNKNEWDGLTKFFKDYYRNVKRMRFYNFDGKILKKKIRGKEPDTTIREKVVWFKK